MSDPIRDACANTYATPGDRYYHEAGSVVHELSVANLSIDASVETTSSGIDAKDAWWLAYLEGKRPVARQPMRRQLRTVDLYCGPGGLSNGLRQLACELGVSVTAELIVDQDDAATAVYAANHPTRRRSSESVRSLVDYAVVHSSSRAQFAYPPEIVDGKLRQPLQDVDVVLAGPPCQGHSNLNNRTRRTDPRNELYLTVPAFASAVGARMCVVENVPSILNDAENVVETATQLFESEGYHVTSGHLSASEMGWAQARTRHFLVARRDAAPLEIADVRTLLRDDARSVWWAIGSLEDQVDQDIVSQVTEVSKENQKRIDWLFDNDEHDLALSERPESHRAGTTYMAVYGRLKKDEPAPTITTGFMSPGRGRFTHPTRRRVLTAREAARLQAFPDTYRFVCDPAAPPPRAQLAKWIGDAVPMPLAYAACLSAFASGL